MSHHTANIVNRDNIVNIVSTVNIVTIVNIVDIVCIAFWNVLFPYMGIAQIALEPQPPLSNRHREALFLDPISLIYYLALPKWDKEMREPALQAFWPPLKQP